jgi:hypothetical protein
VFGSNVGNAPVAPGVLGLIAWEVVCQKFLAAVGVRFLRSLQFRSIFFIREFGNVVACRRDDDAVCALDTVLFPHPIHQNVRNDLWL